MNAIRRCRGLIAAGIWLPASAVALPPDPWGEENLAFRLLLGSVDGVENATVLKNDGHRYSLGISASSPVAWNDRLDANMEIWITERGYAGTTTASAQATDSISLKAEALTYGLRIHTDSGLRPYGLLAVGFQATHLRTTARDDPSITVEEDSLEATAHVGLGLEWETGRDLFSIDWRRWYTQGDFTEFGVRDGKLGGDFLGIGLGHRW
jgi:hypothetical protein